MRYPTSDRRRPTLFVGLGARMLAYDIDTERFMLTRLDASATLPANVQYACAHTSGRYLFVVSSNGGPGVAGDAHYLTSFQIDSDTKALRQLGDHVRLRHRPIHISTDNPSAHALIAYNNPSGVSVHRIDEGRIGPEVDQPTTPDAGVFAHEVRVAPSNRTAIVVARGNDSVAGRSEDPGALKVFRYEDGGLTFESTVAPNGGYGFGPRNLDFSPSHDWVYVSLERQNKLTAFAFDGTTVAATPSFQCETLDDAAHTHPVQLAGAVRVHPDGRFVYLANRAFGMTDEAEPVFIGGENTIVMYEIDHATGEPRHRQSIDTHGIYPRTFSIDPGGRVMVVGNSRPALVRNGATTSMVWASLSVFAIGDDGRLTYERNYEIEGNREQLFWSAMVV
ncbi:MAG: lactonase family protein [Cyanobacteria bacterium]|nr:lactonase family protein [Cyanobacteriota bacterium]